MDDISTNSTPEKMADNLPLPSVEMTVEDIAENFHYRR